MPSTRNDFTINKGLTFGGFSLIALDAAGEPVIIGAGTTCLLQARTAADKPLSFALDVSLGEADGEIIVDEVAAADTADLPVGQFGYDLILIDADSKPWGPFMQGTITVKQPFSQPA